MRTYLLAPVIPAKAGIRSFVRLIPDPLFQGYDDDNVTVLYF